MKKFVSILAAMLISGFAFAESYMVFINTSVIWKSSKFLPTPAIAYKGDIFIKGANMLATSEIIPYDCKALASGEGTYTTHDLTSSYVVVHSLEEAYAIDVDNVDYTEVYTSSGYNITHPGVLSEMMGN